MHRLSDHVDWQYLFREYWHLYRFGSAGGNPIIRSHLKDVRNRLNAELETCLLYTSPSARDVEESRMPSSA